ncbi:MAG: DMT family transporter [Actinobacteria bacterium]|nr:DMT family transporter [Actinomycetota bacterium]
MTGASLARVGLLGCMWGSSFLFIKVALDGLSPPQIVLGRLLFGSLVLLAILAARGQRLPGRPVVWAHLALMGLVGNIVPFALIGWGEQRVTSGLAGVLNGTTALFTTAFALALLPDERLTATRAIGLLLGFTGVVVVVGPWDSNPLTSSLTGQLACLGAAACYALAFAYTRRFLAGRGYRPLVLSASQLAAATGLMLAAAPVVASDPPRLTPVVVASVVALGVVGTGLAYLVYYRLIADVGATSTSMVTYVIPVVAVVLGVATLGEPVTWNLFAGGAVVVAGIALAEGRLDRWSPLRPASPVD